MGHVDVWVFDLDNTLYPATCRLFDQIDVLMGDFIVNLLGCDRAEARRTQKSMFHTHGTTMRGLMTEHGVDPLAFLTHVHDIDYSPVPRMPQLDAALDGLAGRKIIFTNGSVDHAARVLERLGVGHHFEATFDIVAADYRPKPDPTTYRKLVDTFEIEPRRAVLVEDIPQNLRPAHALGMTTVLVHTDTKYAQIGRDGDHVHHVTEDLVAWLTDVGTARRSETRHQAGGTY
ncbi:MAG: pyrimidine 5'-nucleotidase [Alphaproteobacteria bacterium]|nr:pyrimidine 5'-nucleotidase [Alphaproteobacteria bacterium]